MSAAACRILGRAPANARGHGQHASARGPAGGGPRRDRTRDRAADEGGGGAADERRPHPHRRRRLRRVRTRYGVTVVGIKRPGDGFTHATTETVIARRDVLIVTGKIRAVESFAEIG
ncbi:TrkA C-terminal domain-containing protein [Streptomyces sp. NPDC006997]|uniref:TrkA C-terminal domain-containing protein n=1 Tax=Streptomyces sp. NPDC006997 TaxID=3155356 RepID=UPI0033FC3096